MQGDKIIPTDLFEFAYVPNWYGQLDELTEIILPESWRFKKPTSETKNFDTPILERYINLIFRKQSIDHNTAPDTLSAQGFFHFGENQHYTVNAVKSAVSSAWSSMPDTVRGAMNNVRNTVFNIWDNVKNGISDGLGGIRDTV